MRGHIRKRGNKWCVVVDGGRDADGRRRQKWFSGYRTKGDAEDALVTILGRVQRGETVDPDRTPLSEYLGERLKGRRGELAPLSVTQYASMIRTHIEPHAIGRTPLSKLRKAHLRAFELRHLEEKGLAPATRNVIHAVIHKGLAEAVEDDLLAVNPAVGAGARARHTRSSFTVWTQTELHAFLDVVEDDDLGAMWRLAVELGRAAPSSSAARGSAMTRARRDSPSRSRSCPLAAV